MNLNKKKNNIKQCIVGIVCMLLSLFSGLSYAQNRVIYGKVINKEGKGLFLATVYTENKRYYATTDQEGLFTLTVPENTKILHSVSLGYAVQKVSLVYEAIFDGLLRIQLLEETLRLKEVVVIARIKESREGTSVYKISGQAIKQIQAISLGDVLSLLPGNEFKESNQNRVQQASIRTAAASTANAFGTAVIIDGVAMSNDANMQAKNPAASLSGGNATVARGVDLRSIAMPAIESVEVITGLASPKYGNVSSGLIIVKSKTGVQPLYISANITPTTYQIGLSKGQLLKPKWGVLNSNFSYVYSNGSPIEKKTYYQNINLGVKWTNVWSSAYQWKNTAAFQLYYANDGNRHEADEIYKNESDVKSVKYSGSLSGNLNVLGKLSYNFSTSLDQQHSYFNSMQTNGPLPIIESLTSGTFFTSYTPLLYRQVKNIYGAPINFNARIEAAQEIRRDAVTFLFETGLQFVYDKNKGKGRVSSGDISFIGNIVGSRAINFNKIPAAKTFSSYHQTQILRSSEHTSQELRLGLRYDYMNSRYHLVSPRLTASSTFYKKLKFTAAWGLSYKAPALIQIYPSPSYFDYTNFNYYSENPASRLAIVSTKVIQPVNRGLKPSRVALKEFSADWNSYGFSAHLTFYDKKLERGIYLSPSLLILEKQLYEVLETPKDAPPVVQEIPGEIIRILRTVNSPINSYTAHTKGMELTVIPPKIEATNTAFNVRFAQIITEEFDHSYRFRISKYVIGDRKARYGVYENTKTTSYLTKGSLTVIQHLPSLGLVCTLSGDLNFSNYKENEQGSLYPYAFYDTSGAYTPIPENEQSSAAYADLKLAETSYTIYEKPPLYTNFNLQIRKETEAGHSFSFYANNYLWKNPTYEIHQYRRTLNRDISVGFSMIFKLK
ncbi:MAG: hypothetical protein COB98_02630 [Flavobacteriaceae bacterium]|nr:MAG: hypothetical protein COB98_02630 [Flavobacteriaceae bacterium]